MGVGALTYFLLDGAIARRHAASRGRAGRRQAGSAAGTALALGAFLDGLPEQMALGIGLAAGEGVSVGLLVAIFVSNLPEAIGSAIDMRNAGRRRRAIVRLWLAVAAICTVFTVIGYATSGDFRALIDGFAAGALIVMLIDSMIPEASKESGRPAGLATTLGFAVATALSTVS